ncbi:MAG TPA: NHL repeat-containing protein [Pyrinomonadaceae bacterium]|nr:NHL repeat-containing protein [Pyrinomonadaceae bacterium]
MILFPLALIFLGASAAFYFYIYRERLLPTVVNWRARVVTLAGDGAPGLRDAPLANARFADPYGIAVDRAGNVYIADAGDNNCIRKITPEGVISILAGGAEGFADGTGAAASFNSPSSLAIDIAGNLYVADTGNHAVRRVTPAGVVTTLAGDGQVGDSDGPARAARFNGPIGVAVDPLGNTYVADSYNDRIRLITADGRVETIAGQNRPGYADGPGASALFDTPCALAVSAIGELYVADTGNNRVRFINRERQVSTLLIGTPNGDGETIVDGPLGLALTHDNFLYVTEGVGRARVLQITPANQTFVIAGVGRGYADGAGTAEARFNRPAGIAVDRRGALYATDAANYLIRKIVPAGAQGNESAAASDTQVAPAARPLVPLLNRETLAVDSLPWPVDPQNNWHEVTGTMGEVRGSYDGESRDHFHSGIDVQGAFGAAVRSVRDEKVAHPLPNWGLGGINEGTSVGVMTYIHQRVGRDARDLPLRDERFVFSFDEAGKITRLRVRRGARFRVGDQLGTINRMYHVHLNLGPWGAEINPFTLPLVELSDARRPVIERDGVQLFDAATNERLTAKRNGRLLLKRGEIKIVVDAYDQVDDNLARRRLGLYQLGYQLLNSDGTPAPGFAEPRITMRFERLPVEDEAVKIAYADASGITVYGSAATRFLYDITNVVRDGHARRDVWRTADLAPGNYLLRVVVADYAGNTAEVNRDLAVVIE